MNYKIIVNKILKNISNEIKLDENKRIIKQEILEPIIYEVIYSFYPYILSFIVIILISFFLMIAILFLNIRLCYK